MGWLKERGGPGRLACFGLSTDDLEAVAEGLAEEGWSLEEASSPERALSSGGPDAVLLDASVAAEDPR